EAARYRACAPRPGVPARWLSRRPSSSEEGRSPLIDSLLLIVRNGVAEDRAVTNAFVEVVHFIHRCANCFGDSGEEAFPSEEIDILGRHSLEMTDVRRRCLDLIAPWARIVFRIVDRHRAVDRIRTDSGISLFDAGVKTQRMTELIGPHSFV